MCGLFFFFFFEDQRMKISSLCILFIQLLRIYSVFYFYHRQLQSGPWITPPFSHGLSMPCHMLPNILIKRCWMSVIWITPAQGPYSSRDFPSSSQMHSLCMLSTSKSENAIPCGRCVEEMVLNSIKLFFTVGKRSSYNSKCWDIYNCCVLNCTMSSYS